MVAAVTKGLLKIMEGNNLNRLGFKPEHVYCLIKNTIVEKELNNFVDMHQSAFYIVMFWGTDHLEEVRELEI